MADNKNLVTEFLNSKRTIKPSQRRFLKEDYIPSDKKSFSQKYGRRTTLNKNSEDLVPEFVKKLFESENEEKVNHKRFSERNMSYCKFENTYNDLTDCYLSWDECNSDTERNFRKKIFNLCKDIVDECDPNSENNDDDDDDDDDDYEE